METDPRALEAIRRRALEISTGPESGSAVDNWLRAEREHLVAHHYDTLDHDLAQLGMSVARVPSEAGVVWRLQLPRGELVEAWEPGTAGLAPPAEIMEVIGAILDGKPLIPESAVLREPGAARFRSSLAAQLTALLAHDPGVRVARDPENLHQHRVAARRTRAFLRAARAHVDPAWAEGIASLLRELGDATSPARDLDVLLEHLRPLLSAVDDEDRAGAENLLAAFAAQRADAQARLREVLDGDGYRLLLARLRLPPRFRPGVEDVPLDRLAKDELSRLLRSVRRLGARAGDEEIHALRIALKRARYAAELSAPRGKSGRRFLEAAKTLQELLGEHHDAVVAEERLRSTTVRDAATSAAFVAGRLAERQVARRERVAEQLPSAWRRLRKRGAKL